MAAAGFLFEVESKGLFFLFPLLLLVFFLIGLYFLFRRCPCFDQEKRAILAVPAGLEILEAALLFGFVLLLSQGRLDRLANILVVFPLTLPSRSLRSASLTSGGRGCTAGALPEEGNNG